jgi:hypothetical protein
MELPAAPPALLVLADFVVGLLRRAPGEVAAEPVPVVVAPAAPFAANGYARARLLRQLYASGALADRPADTVEVAG